MLKTHVDNHSTQKHTCEKIVVHIFFSLENYSPWKNRVCLIHGESKLILDLTLLESHFNVCVTLPPPPFFKGFEDSRGQEMCTPRANPPSAPLLPCATLEIHFLDNSDLIFRIHVFPPNLLSKRT